ncbi:MAG: hypothetical protein Q9216_003420 [Gyalolechia sp. 2 TL-2023]
MGLFDDVFDDLCPSSLRIPPLQDPFPFPTITDRRLSPLEPNARTNSHIDNEAAKLTGRGKALAEAKLIGDSEDNELRPIHSTPRKRQKKCDGKSIPEFVQLPKPRSKANDGKPPPFLPISILNQLHEPPPSAALLPPITPNAIVADHCRRPSADLLPERTRASSESPKDDKEIRDSSTAKKLCVRKRIKWSEEETYSLVRGVDKFGAGKWTRILNHPEYTFSKGRNPIDLKDRFRTLVGNTRAQPSEGISYQELLGYADGVRNVEPDPPVQKAEPRQPRKKPKHHWSEEEDESLVKGYQKHGFCWRDIANDSSLALSNRSGPQIRDRFRKRFPELYGEAPAPAPASCKGDRNVVGDDSIAAREPKSKGSQAVVPEGEVDRRTGQDSQNRRLSAALPRQVSSVCAPHSISGLLNNNDEENQQSSFRPDDWDVNVTLPPLLWEDLCTKPMPVEVFFLAEELAGVVEVVSLQADDGDEHQVSLSGLRSAGPVLESGDLAPEPADLDSGWPHPVVGFALLLSGYYASDGLSI